MSHPVECSIREDGRLWLAVELFQRKITKPCRCNECGKLMKRGTYKVNINAIHACSTPTNTVRYIFNFHMRCYRSLQIKYGFYPLIFDQYKFLPVGNGWPPDVHVINMTRRKAPIYVIDEETGKRHTLYHFDPDDIPDHMMRRRFQPHRRKYPQDFEPFVAPVPPDPVKRR